MYVRIITRIVRLLFSPAKEWAVIDSEKASVTSLYIGYAAPLALIPATAFVAMNFLMWELMKYDTQLTELLAELSFIAGVSYLLALAVPYVFALIVNVKVSLFCGQPSFVQALKTAVYSVTPVWLASALAMIPKLGFLVVPVGIAAVIYSLVLLWFGLATLMKVPKKTRIGFFISALCSVVVLGFVVIFTLSAVGSMYMFPFEVPDSE